MTEAHRTEEWWTPEQLRLVEDTARSWVRTTFSPSDMLLIRRQPGERSMGRRVRPGERPDPDSEIIEGGWDHEHCELCWAEIAASGEHQREGYTDGKTWICVSCFNAYIAPRLGL
jgi:hypothetical protein